MPIAQFGASGFRCGGGDNPEDDALQPFEERNRHFDRLAATEGLRWMGQNTNHFSPPEAVVDAMRRVIDEEGYHVYAPPAGFEELRALIVEDLGLPGQSAVVTDGAVLGLYHACHTFLGPGDALITTDPSWAWPIKFAAERGAEVRQVPIYGREWGYRLDPARLEAAMDARVRVIYFVDPNNPLGTVPTRAEIEAARSGRVAQRERGLDQRLGVGARHQRLRREPEAQPPELGLAEDAPDRLAGEPARGEGRQPRRRGLAERLLGMGEEVVAREPGRLEEEDARIERRLVEAGGGEGAPQRVERRAPGSLRRNPRGGRAHPCCSASSAAWCSAVRASTTSSSASPERTASSL